MADKKVKINIGYTLDKTGLEEMQSYFQRIANQAAEPGNKLNTGLQQAGKTAQTLDSILEKTFNTNLGTLNVTKFNQELQKSGLTMKQVQADLTAIGNQGVTAYNRLSQAILGTNLQLKQSSKLLDSMFTTFKNTVRYGISSSIFNNFTNSIVKAYDYTRKLDTSLNNIRIVTGQSAEQMDKFAIKANDAAKQLGASTLDMTEASLIYYQQGLSDAEAQARAETTVKVANVTSQSADEVSEQLTAVWNGYKVSADEAELHVDKLAAVAATTASDLEELSTGMSKVASAASSMGVNFDDLTAQISTIVSVTRQAPESVGTALKTIYARLGDLKVDGVDEFGTKLGEVSSQLQTMGIEILDQNGNMRDMSSVMAEVAQKWQTWTDAQRQAAAVAMAGKRQYNNLIALFNNWDMYSDALETAANAAGTLQKQQDIYMESTQAKLTKLRATWQDLYKSVGDTKTINVFIDGIRDLVQVFDNFSDSFGGGLKSIIAFGSVIANIFNKQISQGINNTIQRMTVLKNNAEQLRQQVAERERVAQLNVNSDTMNAGDIAALENLKIQAEYSERIYKARAGLTEEQIQNLVNQQKEIGLLTEEISLADHTLKTYVEKGLVSEKDANNLQQYKATLEEITAEYRQQGEAAINSADALKDTLNGYSNTEADIENIISSIEDMSEIITKEDIKQNAELKEQKDIFNNIINDLKKEEDQKGKIIADDKIISDTHNKIKETVRSTIKLYEQESKAQEQQIRNVTAYNKKLEERRTNTTRSNAIRQDADDMLKLGEQGQKVGQIVTSVTSSLSSMAMAWSSVNSLFQTWNDETANFGDKITQTFFTLGMVIPTLISSWTKLNEVFGTSGGLIAILKARFVALEAAKKADIISSETQMAIEKISNSTKKELISNTAGAIVLKNKDKLITGEQTAEEIVHNLVEKKAIELNDEEAAGLIALIKKKIADTTATEGATVAQNAWNKSILAFPGTWLVAALVAVAAITATVIKLEEEKTKKIVENNNAEIERVKTIQSEIDANKDLYNSYEEIYNKYKKDLIEKEELISATEKIAEKYKLEGIEIARLTGNYDDLTIAIRKAREEELKRAKVETQRQIKATESNILPAAREGNGYVLGDQYRLSFSQGISTGDEEEISEILKKYNFHGIGGIDKVIDANSSSIIELYDNLKEARDEAFDTLDSEILNESEVYQNLDKWIEKMTPKIEEYRESLKKLEDYNVQQVLLESDFDGISSLEEYEKKITSISERLVKELDKTPEEVEELIKAYTKTSTNEIIKQGYALDELKKKYPELKKSILDANQTEFLLSGKFNIEEIQGLTSEQIKEKIDIEMQKISPNDLTIPISLMAKISTDKKLNKTEIKEQLGEENKLAQDYEVEFADFDTKSMLGQSDTMNQIIQKEVDNRKEYLNNVQDLAKKEVEIEKEKYEKIAYYQEKFDYYKTHGIQNATDAADFENAKNQLKELLGGESFDNYINRFEKLQDIAENGLDFESLDSLNFETWTTGIDATINSIKSLNKSIEDIGENWSIATERIEEFAMNYPSILADQENFNYLQDGSIALTEKGQLALQNQIDLRKADIKAQGQAYMIELEKQADLQYAQAEYYQQQIDALQAYLNEGADAAETEKALRESVYNYSAKVAKLTGKTNEEVMSQILENSNINRENEYQNEQAIFDYWIDCGEAVSRYGMAVLAKDHHYTPPKPNALAGRNTGSNLSRDDLKTWDEEYRKRIEKESGFNLEDEITDEVRNRIQQRINELVILRNKALDKGDIEMAKRASYDAQINALENNLSNLGRSKSGKDKKQEQFDDEFDRYYDIKKAIDLVNNALDKLSKIQDKLHGKELIQSLKNENDLIKQQSKNYEELYRQQKIELEEVQGTLSDFGAEFDDNGYLTNYASLTASALEQYETKIAEYNAGKISEEAKTAYEKSYEQLKKYLDRYDALFYSEMKDTQDKLDENQRKIMENNLKMWETEIQIRLDTSQAKRDWADFLKEINEDFRKIYKDLNIEMDHLMTKMETYSGLGTIVTDLQAVQDVMIEIDKIESGQGSDMFESTSDAQEKLKELDKQLEDDAKNMKSLWEEAWDAYLEGIDQAESKLDFMNDRFEKINEELEFQSKLIELLYGDEAYSLMDKLYKGQEAMIRNNIAGVQEQANMWHRLWEESGATLENQSDWTEDQEKYYENWQDQQSKLNDLVTNYIELLQTDYLNTVNDVLSRLEKSITGGNVLEDVKDQWDKISSYTDKYFDSIEQIYEAQKFANKIDADIAKTTGRNQQKLMAIREKEITYLREKKNLTQYDLDAAEARYQITLKEIALEEAQNNKTSMKLVRNEEGNWAYQYMADADDIADKQDDLLTSYGDLYKLAGDAYQKNLEELQSLEESYLASAQKIAEKYREDPIKLQEELNKIEAEYQEDKNRLVEENTLYRNDLQTSGAGLLLQVYNQDEEAYDFMTQSEKTMLDSLIGYSISSYQELEVACAENYNNIQQASESAMTSIREDWTASAQLIAEIWAADDGQSVMSQIVSAYAAIGHASLDYQALVEQCAEQVSMDFGENGISGAINEAAETTNYLKDTVEDFCNESENYLLGLKDVVEQVGSAFQAIVGSVQSAISKVQEYLAIVGRAKSVSAANYDITGGGANIGSYDNLSNGGSSGGGGNAGSLEKYIIVGDDVAQNHPNVKILTNSGEGWNSEDEARKAGEAFGLREDIKNQEIRDLFIIKKGDYSKWVEGTIQGAAFKTGGYTGTWGEDGRLAVLHQKELVLNAKDTSNFLNGISLLRDMVSLNGSIEQSIAAAIGGMALQLGGVSASSINNNSNQAVPAFAGDTYYVTADFPNANNAEEIKQAIMNLPNIVSQALGRNTI